MLNFNFEEYLEKFRNDLKNSSDGLENLPSYITQPESFPKNEKVVSIDMGGTNFRIANVVFDSNGVPSILNQTKCQMPGAIGQDEIDINDFFDFVANKLKDYPGEKVGLCFSYLSEILPNNDARIITFSKGVRIRNAEGKLLGEGINHSLEKMGEVMKLNVKKDTTGKMLIKYFSTPCEPTKSNGYRTRNLPKHDPERWELYKRYNITDVETESELYYKLINLPDAEYPGMWDEWYRDWEINERGVSIDLEFVQNAYDFGSKYSEELEQEIIKLTGVSNPKSNAQLKKWIEERTGECIESLTKTTDLSYLNDVVVQKVFSLRNELQKTSLAKYEAMLDCVCEDGKVRGLLQFYGASTGRWAGRLIQVQNLPKNKMPDLADARAIVRRGDYDAFRIMYDKPNDVLSELIRTAFIPETFPFDDVKKKFIVSDYSSIEAAVIGWLAQEGWVCKAYNNKEDLYKATASQMFNLPVDQIDKNLRAKGKVATLALGYQGSSGALIAMGALKMGIAEEELPHIVKLWRAANPHIVKLWSDVQNNCIDAINNPGNEYSLPSNKNVKFKKTGGILFITLPSGRKLKYVNAKVKDSGRLSYMGVRQNEGTVKQWCEVDTFGGKITENIVQAIARDCLMNAINNVANTNGRGHCYVVRFHVHDEIIVDTLEDERVENIVDLMSKDISWAPGLHLRAAGYECQFYMKD